MLEIFVTIFLLLIAVYLVVGIVFAIPFILKGIHVLDEGAHGSGIGFKIIIAPGVIVFWPVLLKKWLHIRQAAKSPLSQSN